VGLLPYLIALKPPEELANKVRVLRQMISNIWHNPYGQHEPHVTLLVSTFTDAKAMEKEIMSSPRSCRRFEARIEGLHVIQEDPLFGGRTLVYKVAANEILTWVASGSLPEIEATNCGWIP
jgi:hypothetical protein